MFTVVIAEKEQINNIRAYDLFLKPFSDPRKVAVCEWFQDELLLDDMVPRLAEAIARNKEWRAIVLCDERGIQQKNPFDCVPYQAPPQDPQLSQVEYLGKLREAKFAAFEQAASQPLTRLMTWLCEAPMVSHGINNHADEDPEFAEYVAENLKKQELRQQIIGGNELRVSRPSEVICVAKRVSEQTAYEINTAWTFHQELEYSRFYDWNMYFDKMRYLVFDVLPKNHEDYEFDCIRFLYALLILANNETPSGALQPNRLFRFLCKNDEEALRRLLADYDAKLAQTSEDIELRVQEILRTEKPRLSDRDAKNIFCSHITVPVMIPKDVELEGLYCDPDSLGLSRDCPRDEGNAWYNTYRDSRRTLLQLLKQPRRALKNAVVDLRRLNNVSLDKVWCLNEFQAEDVADHTAKEELYMVQEKTPDIFDNERYDEKMEKSCHEVNRKIETRMTRRVTLALGLTALALYLAGFFNLIFGNIGNAVNRLWAFGIMGLSGAVLAAIMLVCLFFLRSGLQEKYRAFNRLMHGIENEVETSLDSFSKYLSHACNVMRGFSVLNCMEEYKDPDALTVQVMRKHIADITCVRAELREVFGDYAPEMSRVLTESVEGYRFDFQRPVDYEYPVPYNPAKGRFVEFMQPGNKIFVPVDFVEGITLMREELYD